MRRLALLIIAAICVVSIPDIAFSKQVGSTRSQSFRLGHEYFIPPGIPEFRRPTRGKVEVILPFLYTYGRAEDNEFLKAWLQRKPDYINVVRLPDVRWPHAEEQAKLHFTLQEMGRTDLHDRLYEWIWDDRRYPVYHNLYYPDREAIFSLSLEFARLNGLDVEEFTKFYWSKAIFDRVRRARFASHMTAVGIRAVVCGRYATSPDMTLSAAAKNSVRASPEEYSNSLHGKENMERFFSVIEYLASENRSECLERVAKDLDRREQASSGKR